MNTIFKTAFLLFATFVALAKAGDPVPPPTTSPPATSPSPVPPSGCIGEGWFPVGDEKCYKLIKDWKTYDQAADFCNKQLLPGETFAPTLAMIKSAQDQAELTKLIFDQSPALQTNVWIGARQIVDKVFQWVDGSRVSGYTNWAADSPSEVPQKDCVVMHSIMTRAGANGQWKNVGCGNPNYFLCEKTQVWSFERIRDDYLRTKAEFKNSQIPIGFIYVQLPNATSPEDMWPRFKWTDDSSTYAGVFFRVEGGEAAPFGSIQEDNVPKVKQVETKWWKDISKLPANEQVRKSEISLNNGMTTNWTYTGKSDNQLIDYSRFMRFTTSSGEVRPRNMAFRVWKRTG